MLDQTMVYGSQRIVNQVLSLIFKKVLQNIFFYFILPIIFLELRCSHFNQVQGVPHLYGLHQYNLISKLILHVLHNQYEFCIVKFFPGPKNRTKWGPPLQVTTIFVNTQIFSCIFKLGFRNIQEKLENVWKTIFKVQTQLS